MARSLVVSGLERKYARLLGRHLKKPSPFLASDLSHIRAVMRLFDPHWRPEDVAPVGPRGASRWDRKGRGTRTAIAVIKAADGPLSATEIARAAYVALGREPPHNNELRLVGTDLAYSLRRVMGDRLEVIDGRPKRYRLRAD